MNERHFRTLAEQVDEICQDRNIFRMDIADKMGVSHPYISQIISRGGTAEHIERIAKALEIDPFHFDRYHVLTLMKRIEKHDQFALEFAFLLIDAQKMSKRRQTELLGKLAA